MLIEIFAKHNFFGSFFFWVFFFFGPHFEESKNELDVKWDF